MNNQVGKTIKVLIGQVSMTRYPNILQSVLGSCIGLAIFDPVIRIGGLAHILLPSSKGRAAGSLPGKYADRAIPCLLDGLIQHGAIHGNMKAKIAGGAKMFNASINGNQQGQDIGASNIEAVRQSLRSFGIPIVAADVGGDAGRKVEFELLDYQMTVEDFAQRRKTI